MELESPAQAIEELRRSPQGSVKLVLTEYQFPDGSGEDLLRWIKANGSTSSIPVVFVCHPLERQTVIELVSNGASTIVSKPFGGDNLLRRVTETLTAQVALRQGQGESVSWPLEDYLRKELKRAERNGSYFSLLVCRVLDPMNGQALPHLMGGLVHIMRESDVLAKLSEDEIVILLPDTDGSGATTVEERVRKLAEGFTDQATDRLLVPLKVATGCAVFPTQAADGEALVALARSRCN